MKSELALNVWLRDMAVAILKNGTVTEKSEWKYPKTYHEEQQEHYFYCLTRVLEFERNQNEPLLSYIKRAAAL